MQARIFFLLFFSFFKGFPSLKMGESNKGNKMVGGVAVTQQEFDAWKYSAPSVGTFYSTQDSKGMCLTVLLPGNWFLMLDDCRKLLADVQFETLSFGSLHGLSALTGSTGVTETYTLYVTSHVSPFSKIYLYSNPGNPVLSKKVPATVSTSPTPPPKGQKCVVFGFSDGTNAGLATMNRLLLTVVDATSCASKWMAASGGLTTVNPLKQFCAQLSVGHANVGYCQNDKSAPIFCKQWIKDPIRKEFPFLFSKDDEEEDDEGEEGNSDVWVFAGMLSVTAFGGCGVPQTLPTIFHYYKE